MSFASDETSVQDGRPIELYTFTTPTGSTYVTSAERDTPFAGVTFVAVPMSRGNTQNVQIGNVRSLDITMSVKHALVQSLIGNGIPPRDCLVTVYKIHASMVGQVSDQLQIWRGFVAGVTTQGQVAVIRVFSQIDDLFQVRLPNAKAQRLCQHMLYDTACGVVIAHPVVTVTNISTNKLDITLSGGLTNGKYKYGALTTVLESESRSILNHVGSVVTIDVPFPALANGQSVVPKQGCDHRAITCRDDFANILNFGGHPHFLSANPSWFGGQGISLK